MNQVCTILIAVAIATGLASWADRALSAVTDTDAKQAGVAYFFAKWYFDPRNEREIEYGGTEMQFMRAALDLCRTRPEIRDTLPEELPHCGEQEEHLGPFSCLSVYADSWGDQVRTPGRPPVVAPLLRLATDCRRVAPLSAPREALDRVGWWALCGVNAPDAGSAECEGALLADWLCEMGIVYLTFSLNEDGNPEGYYATLCFDQPRDLHYISAQLRADPFWLEQLPNCRASVCAMGLTVTDGSRQFEIEPVEGPGGFQRMRLRFVDHMGGHGHGWNVSIVNRGGNSPGTWKLEFETMAEFGNR